MQSVELKIEKRKGMDYIFYHGPLNEEAGLRLIRLHEEIGKECVFNFRHLTHTNSLGIAAWISFFRVFKDGRKVFFEECATDLVSQFNMISSMFIGAHINSAAVPYICDGCNTRASRLAKIEKAQAILPTEKVICEHCRKEMELEEAKDEYFGFLTRIQEDK